MNLRKKGFVEDEVGVAGWYMLMVGFCTTNGDEHRKPDTAVLVKEIVDGPGVLIQEFKVGSLVETTEGCASVCATLYAGLCVPVNIRVDWDSEDESVFDTTCPELPTESVEPSRDTLESKWSDVSLADG